MKFAVSFLFLAAALIYLGNPMIPSWRWALLWPAANLLVASGFYFSNWAKGFGKSGSGKLAVGPALFFIPYRTGLWWVWYLFARCGSENRFDQLMDRVWIGRKLDRVESRDASFETIIDLTAEFPVVKEFTKRDYHAFPILDGAVPGMVELLHFLGIAEGALKAGKSLYIHCAQGHGRTGLFAAALLVHIGKAQDLESAMKLIHSARPRVRCNRRQSSFLRTRFNELRKK